MKPVLQKEPVVRGARLVCPECYHREFTRRVEPGEKYGFRPLFRKNVAVEVYECVACGFTFVFK